MVIIYSGFSWEYKLSVEFDFSPEASKPPEGAVVELVLSATARVEDTGDDPNASKPDSSRSAGAEDGTAAGVGVTVGATGEIKPTNIGR